MLAIETRTDLNDNNHGKNNYKTNISSWNPPIRNHSNNKTKVKLPSGGAGKGILWLENNGKEI